MEHTIKSAENLECDLHARSLDIHACYLEHLLLMSTRCLKHLRQRITGSFYLWKKLIANVGDNIELQNKYKRRMSTLNHNTAECETVVRHLLEINLQLTRLLSKIRKNIDVHVDLDNRHIKLSDQTNFFFLLPPEIVSMSVDLTIEENSQYIKQGSGLWHEQRSSTRVTGSSLRNTIGLDTLMKQKEHHHINVVGRQAPPPDVELQKKFDHGKENEVHATATLTSTVGPAFLPDCYAFFEVGPKFIHDPTRHKLMEVSPDGIYMCSNGGVACQNYHLHGDRKILLEIKSPFPSEDVPESVYYEVPVRHIPQLLAEMKAYNCFELWLVCSIKRSCSVIVVTFDPELWSSIWKLAMELYADEIPKIPTRLHLHLQEIKLMISKYTRTCCRLLCEVPTVTGDYGEVYIDPNFSSSFSPNNLREIIEPDIEDIQETSKFIAINSKAAFKACYEVLRTPAKELLVFMLTNKDRKQDKKVPYSYPIAYVMKGHSMSNNDLKFMVRKLRNILYTKNIPVLCEAYDGQ